jgi:hypothetical protein
MYTFSGAVPDPVSGTITLTEEVIVPAKFKTAFLPFDIAPL